MHHDPSEDIRPILRQLVEGQPLSRTQAHDVFAFLMSGQAPDAQIAALLTVLQARPTGPTVDEITGAATVMRRHVRRIAVPPGMAVVDIVGTGGDHSSTFNISTTAAIVAAAAGVPVVKHGNRSVTSRSGSSQVLEALGVKLEVDDQVLGRCLDEAGLCFAFAPAHHPAMKYVAPVRKQLGFRTIFNILGPLTNPAGAERMVLGVFDARLTETLAAVLNALGAVHVMVVHGSGMDELSTVGPTDITIVRQGRIESARITPQAVGLTPVPLERLQVESVQQSAEVVRSVLAGQPGPARQIVLLNAAAALVVAEQVDDLSQGIARAAEAIDSCKAQATLDRLVAVSNG